MLEVFNSTDDFFTSFPAPEKVTKHFEKLKTIKNQDDYINELTNISKNKDVKEFFNIVKDSHSARGLDKYKKYRKENIEKYTDLKLVNKSKERQFKY